MIYIYNTNIDLDIDTYRVRKLDNLQELRSKPNTAYTLNLEFVSAIETCFKNIYKYIEEYLGNFYSSLCLALSRTQFNNNLRKTSLATQLAFELRRILTYCTYKQQHIWQSHTAHRTFSTFQNTETLPLQKIINNKERNPKNDDK